MINTTNARKHLATLIDKVKTTGEPVVIGRHNRAEVIVMKAPHVSYNPELDDITNLSAMGGTFDFLLDEPDLYESSDIKFSYEA